MYPALIDADREKSSSLDALYDKIKQNEKTKQIDKVYDV